MKTLCQTLLIVAIFGLSSDLLVAQSGSRSPLVPRDEVPSNLGTSQNAQQQVPSNRLAMLDASANLASTDPNVESFEPGQTLAVVGGYPIFVSDMSMEIFQIMDRLLAGAPESFKKTQKPLLIKKLLPKYIDAKLLYVDVVNGLPDEANLEDIFESAGKQFDENVLPFFKQQAGVVSAAELDAQLRVQGSSLRLMRKSWTENELVKYMTKSKIEDEADISRAELLSHYQEHLNEYSVEAKARWEQVMVRFDKYDSREDARNALAILGNKIVNGASFSATAKNNSHGIKAAEGGLNDWTVKGSLVSSALDTAIFQLPMNELSDIIESGIGYHIVRVIERQDEGFVPFVEAQSEIRTKIEETKREEKFQAHLKELRQQIPVEILIEDVQMVR